MKVKVIAYSDEPRTSDTPRTVLVESIHDADAAWFKGQHLRDLVIEHNGTEKLLGIVGSCTVYLMNDSGKTFDTRYFD